MTFLACESFADVDAVLAREECTLTDDDFDLIGDALDAASDIVYVLSNGRVTGMCTKTMRPVRRSGGWCTSFGPPDPWFDTYGVDCIPLADNLISVDSVKVDGLGLLPSEYGLLDNTVLFRKDASYWPRVNNLLLDDTEVGTFSVTYKFGNLPDWLAQAATVDVAIQLLDDFGRGRGYLRGVRSANIQGASVQLEQQASALASAGLPMLERFLNVHAPMGSVTSGVWAPELENGWLLVEVEGPSGS
jgi:hypothetical protein